MTNNVIELKEDLLSITQDVSLLKRKLIGRDALYDAKIAYLNGHANIAKNLLDNYFKSTIENDVASQAKEDLLKEIVKTYKYLGFEAPTIG